MSGPSKKPSPEFLRLFRAHADSAGRMTFAQFMELALYDPALGYYRRNRQRVGYAPGTDFFTSSTSGPLFGELIVAACTTLLRGHNPADFAFVEIGAESGGSGGGGVLAKVAHPFASVRTIAPGELIDLKGRCVVFSNELFDAQPFNRFVFREGRWRELGVQLQGDRLAEVELPTATDAPLPSESPELYHLDAPLAARRVAGTIAAQPWEGLFVAADYGKSWRELTEETPAGTARAYFQHQQFNDLLAQPGEQDLTCHICWDWLAAALADHGFGPPQIESQEAFFIHHAGEFIANVSAVEAARFSQRKLSLMQLLHPTHMGQKFQVLHSFRL